MHKHLPAIVLGSLFLLGLCFLAINLISNRGSALLLPARFRVHSRSIRQEQPANVFATIFDLEVTISLDGAC